MGAGRRRSGEMHTQRHANSPQTQIADEAAVRGAVHWTGRKNKVAGELSPAGDGARTTRKKLSEWTVVAAMSFS